MAMPDNAFPPPASDAHALETGTRLTPRFDAQGVLAAVCTDAETGEVLMLAWMDAAALARTIETREAHFYSRSRKRMWKKGEESGNVLDVLEMRTDCDQDAIWLVVRMRGAKAACHTGRRTCFYRRVPLGGSAREAALEDGAVATLFDPARVYGGPAKA